MLFFPSHDIALANGIKHFNPPTAALQLQEDLKTLSDIWNQPFLKGESPFPLPWGWNWDTRQYIHKHYDVRLKDLPTDEDLHRLRTLSSRLQTIYILDAIQARAQLFDAQQAEDRLKISSLLPPIRNEFLSSESELYQYIQEKKEKGVRFVLKSPWSSSGRGLTRSDVCSEDTLIRRGLPVIRKMGGILAEEWIDQKEQDFAMLFYVGRESVRWVGYSMFEVDAQDTYRFGWLMSNHQMERQILNKNGAPISEQGTAALSFLRDALISILSDLFKDFFGRPFPVGYIGIDMMSYRPKENSSTGLCIHPCIEMNVRCTMGVVARLWFDQNRKEGDIGRFEISPLEADGHFHYRFV